MWPCPAPLRKLMAGAKLGRPAKRVLMESFLMNSLFTNYVVILKVIQSTIVQISKLIMLPPNLNITQHVH